jgi:hypothetical protein
MHDGGGERIEWPEKVRDVRRRFFAGRIFSKRGAAFFETSNQAR